MISRTSFTFAMAMLIVVAHLHCLCHQEVQALSDLRLEAGAPAPVLPFPERHCDNEYGCICKGATIVAAVDCEQIDSSHVWSLPSIEDVMGMTSVSVTTARGHEQHSLPALSGRILRAHISSLVI